MTLALILAAVAFFVAALLLTLVILLRRMKIRSIAALHADLAASGEKVLVGPESAVYRGGSGSYSKVKGNGTIVLTDRRLLFHKLTGGVVEVARSAIVGVKRSKGFQGSRVGGQTHLVVATAEPAEVGFFVQNLDAWERALG